MQEKQVPSRLKRYDSILEIMTDLELNTDIMECLVDIYRDIKNFQFDPERNIIYSKRLPYFDDGRHQEYDGVDFIFKKI